MRITIDTDGHGDNTTIAYNGIKQENIKEFCITIKAGRPIKLQVVE